MGEVGVLGDYADGELVLAALGAGDSADERGTAVFKLFAEGHGLAAPLDELAAWVHAPVIETRRLR